MVRFWRAGLLLATLVLPAALVGQEAPLLTVVPRQEQVRQLESHADLRMVRKRYLEAIDLYQQALRLAPRDPALLNKIGIAYHQLLRLDDAKKYYERATRADEGYAQAWNNLGTVYYGLKNYNKAIRCYRRALRLAPAQAAIHSNLGVALFAKKEYEPALAEFRLAMQLDPDVFQTRSLFGVLMQDHAVQDRARFYFLVAKGFASQGLVEKCLAFLRRALEEGFPPAEAQGDPAFVLIREDERFQTLFADQPPPLKP